MQICKFVAILSMSRFTRFILKVFAFITTMLSRKFQFFPDPAIPQSLPSLESGGHPGGQDVEQAQCYSILIPD